MRICLIAENNYRTHRRIEIISFSTIQFDVELRLYRFLPWVFRLKGGTLSLKLRPISNINLGLILTGLERY